MKWMVAAIAVAAVCVYNAPAQTTYLYNGSFSQGVAPYGDPASWDAGEVSATTGLWRDSVDFHSAPASLGVMRIDTGNGGSYNQAFRNASRLPAAPGATFTWDAWVKVDSSNGGSFQLVVHTSCGTYWTECASGGWVTLHMFNAPNGGWQQYSGTGTVANGATWGLLRIWTSGIIAYHIDDIRINGQNEVVSILTGERHPISMVGVAALQPTDHVSVYSPSGKLVASTTKAQLGRLPAGAYVMRAGQQRMMQVQVGR